MPHKTVFGLLVVLALAIGYIAGTGRAGGSLPSATAGPTEVGPGLYITSDGQSQLTVWNLSQGQVARATKYNLLDRVAVNDKGEPVETWTVEARTFTPPPPAPPRGK